MYCICKINITNTQSKLFVIIQDEGVDFTIDGVVYNFHGTIALIAADNLVSQSIGGYKAHNGALRKCRFCLAIKETMSSQVNHVSGSIPHNYEQECMQVWLWFRPFNAYTSKQTYLDDLCDQKVRVLYISAFILYLCGLCQYYPYSTHISLQLHFKLVLGKPIGSTAA